MLWKYNCSFTPSTTALAKSAKFKYSYDYIRKTIFDFINDKKTKKSMKKNGIIPEARHAVFCIHMMQHPWVR